MLGPGRTLVRVEDERRKVKKELEAKQRANRRAILQRAEKEGLRDDFVADLLNSLEVVTIDEPADVSSSPSDPPPPPSVPVSSPPSVQEDRLLQLLGSQRLKNSLPKDADQFHGDVLGYPRFIAIFTTDVLEVDGVTDAEKYSALQDCTRGEARKIVDTHVYLKS